MCAFVTFLINTMQYKKLETDNCKPALAQEMQAHSLCLNAAAW